MKIHHYQEKTGELIGEGFADRDPMEADRWLIPAHATNVTPPDHMDGSTRHFIAGKWEYREIPPPPPEPVAETTAAPSVPME